MSLAFIGSVELERGEDPKALRYLLEELDLLIDEMMPTRMVMVSTIIGDIYTREKLYEDALPYYHQALTQSNSNYLNQKLGNSYAALLKPDTAYIYYAKQLPFVDKNNPNLRINIYHDIVCLLYTSPSPRDRG